MSAAVGHTASLKDLLPVGQTLFICCQKYEHESEGKTIEFSFCIIFTAFNIYLVLVV